MNKFKEIVTKAIVGKGKKTFKNNYEIALEDEVDTVLGCWIINHTMSGKNNNGKVKINGSYDVNIWYSYDGNTKTGVASKRINYEHNVDISLKDDGNLNDSSEIIIRSLKNPTCVEVSSEDNVIKYVVEKELGIEIIGDTKVKIAIYNDEEDYDTLDDSMSEEELNDVIDEIDEVNEEYLG